MRIRSERSSPCTCGESFSRRSSGSWTSPSAHGRISRPCHAASGALPDAPTACHTQQQVEHSSSLTFAVLVVYDQSLRASQPARLEAYPNLHRMLSTSTVTAEAASCRVPQGTLHSIYWQEAQARVIRTHPRLKQDAPRLAARSKPTLAPE